MIEPETEVELSIVAPCLNEEEVIGAFLRRSLDVCEKLGCTFEIVIIDDGSTDSTWSILKGHAQKDARIRAIRLARNFGHQAALSAGLIECRGRQVLLIDADLQDPPELLPEMLQVAKEQESDMVYGQRKTREGVSLLLSLCYKNFYRLLGWLAGCEIPADAGDFRLVSRRLVDVVNAMPEQNRFLRGMFSWTGYKQVALPYDRKARAAGTPAYTWKKLFALAADGILSFSVKPLRLATAAAGILAMAGLAVMAWIILGYTWFDKPPQGWASLMVVVLFVGALQLLVLGVIGEYIGRIFMAQKNRPDFIVAERTS